LAAVGAVGAVGALEAVAEAVAEGADEAVGAGEVAVEGADEAAGAGEVAVAEAQADETAVREQELERRGGPASTRSAQHVRPARRRP
jgi:hypothetical protein